MHAGHHPLAGGVVEDRSLATDRFGHQRLLAESVRAAPHDGRVELDELDVGDGQAGAQRHRDAVAGDRRRVRRRGEDLAVAARRDHDGTGGHDADGGEHAVFVGLADPHADDLALAVVGSARDEVEREGVTHHLDTGADRGFVERSLHLGAGAVAAGVHDAVVAVAALTGERDVGATLLRVERRTQPHEVPDRLRCLGHQLTHDRLVAQPRTRFERVADVVLDRVARVEHAGEPALGPLRGTGGQDVLGDHQHAAHRPHGQRRRQPRCARAEHHDVDVALPRRRRRRQPPRQTHRPSPGRSDRRSG